MTVPFVYEIRDNSCNSCRAFVVVRVFTPRPRQLDGAAHLRYRRVSQRCGQSPLAITIDSVVETGKTPAESHFRSCPNARRSPPVTARPVHPAAIASTNQTTRHYLPRGI